MLFSEFIDTENCLIWKKACIQAQKKLSQFLLQNIFKAKNESEIKRENYVRSQAPLWMS